MDLQAVLQAIYDSGGEVTAAIRDEWDQGWQVTIDDAMEPLAANLTAAAEWLHAEMLRRYPTSKYKARLDELSRVARRGSPKLCEVLESLYKNEDRVGLRLVSGKGWDVTFNHTVHRSHSLQEAAQWLNRRIPASNVSAQEERG